MADNKDKQNQSGKKPDRDANATPMPDEYSNTANHKGAVDLGTDGTKATASQQQGQGSWSKKSDKNREGSDKENSGGGQGGKNQTGK
ncbi:hypothetical protein ACFSRY_02075 [Pontibacter locisalis]|uniref:Uncharacterized protein n=1 Tax=Pontibacter locisalis TaxID=1719035 RepID=A0ABW5IIA4_9BACT